MKIFPLPTATRFEQLNPGDLFFIDLKEGRFAALKAVDGEQDGDTLMVFLGPTFNQEILPGMLLPWRGVTVVSLATSFSVLLPTKPTGWTTTEPNNNILPLVLSDCDLYVRALYSGLGRAVPCLVKISDGTVIYNQHLPISAFALDWELAVVDERGFAHSVLRMNQS